MVDVQEIDQYASVRIPEHSWHCFVKYGCYAVLFWRSGVMLFCALLLGFWVEMVEPAFIAGYKVKQEIIALGSRLLKTYLLSHLYLSFCICP
jgi:hypothetical protein